MKLHTSMPLWLYCLASPCQDQYFLPLCTEAFEQESHLFATPMNFFPWQTKKCWKVHKVLKTGEKILLCGNWTIFSPIVKKNNKLCHSIWKGMTCLWKWLLFWGGGGYVLLTHCTGCITTGRFMGGGNQYIQLVSRFCTVNCRPTASNYQLSHFRPCREPNPGLRGGRRECYHSAKVAPYSEEYKLIIWSIGHLSGATVAEW